MSDRNQKIVEMLNRRQLDLTVFMDEVHKPHNLAAIVRTCDAVGIGHVHAVLPQGRMKACSGTAMGSNRWVETHIYSDLDSGVAKLKDEGFQILAAHFSEDAVDFREIDYTQPTALLMGSEKFGVSDVAAAQADRHILIPMLGMVQSLNVSVAAAIILYEAQRQRETAGMYNRPQLDSKTIEQLRFEWLHPKLTKFCHLHGVPYPKMNESGAIEDRAWELLRDQVTK